MPNLRMCGATFLSARLFISAQRYLPPKYTSDILFFFIDNEYEISLHLTWFTSHINCYKSRPSSVFETHDSSSLAASHQSFLDPPVAV